MGKKRHLPIKKYILLFLLLGLLFLLFFLAEQKLLPSLQEISHIQCKTYANQVIDTATKKVLDVIFCERKEWIGIEERSSA